MWLQHLSGLLAASMTVCHAIEKKGRPVLVHCSDGWDRTPQIVATAQLCLDPYYRTVEVNISFINDVNLNMFKKNMYFGKFYRAFAFWWNVNGLVMVTNLLIAVVMVQVQMNSTNAVLYFYNGWILSIKYINNLAAVLNLAWVTW